MRHGGSWRAACLTRNWVRIPHFEVPSVARVVTASCAGFGALLDERRGSGSEETQSAGRASNVSKVPAGARRVESEQAAAIERTEWDFRERVIGTANCPED
jgi:hypothetical protein